MRLRNKFSHPKKIDMKKIIKYITECIRPLFLLFAMLFIISSVIGQNKITVGVQSNSAEYVRACGDYPSLGTSVHAFSVLTAGKECNTTIIESASTVYFTARDSIILLPGFKALSGSKFIARIESNSLDEQTNNPKEIDEANKNIAQSVTIFPNPFSRNFMAMINSKRAGKVQLTIYNSSGEKVMEKAGVNVVKGLNELNFTSNFAAGIYMLEVNFGDSKIVNKIIKSN